VFVVSGIWFRVSGFPASWQARGFGAQPLSSIGHRAKMFSILHFIQMKFKNFFGTDCFHYFEGSKFRKHPGRQIRQQGQGTKLFF
jgi:hypothetical protein